MFIHSVALPYLMLIWTLLKAEGLFGEVAVADTKGVGRMLSGTSLVIGAGDWLGG